MLAYENLLRNQVKRDIETRTKLQETIQNQKIKTRFIIFIGEFLFSKFPVEPCY